MSRLSLFVGAAVVSILTASSAMPVNAESTATSAPSASGKKIAIALPRPKVEKPPGRIAAPAIKPWEDVPGKSSPNFDKKSSPQTDLKKALRQSARFLEDAKKEAGRKYAELVAWISSVFKNSTEPKMTPVSSPRLKNKKFQPIPEPSEGHGAKMYLRPQGRIQTVVER